MNPLDYKDVISLYVATFGQEPEITGGSFFNSLQIIERLIEAIDTGKPFKDEPLPDGALV